MGVLYSKMFVIFTGILPYNFYKKNIGGKGGRGGAKRRKKTPLLVKKTKKLFFGYHFFKIIILCLHFPKEFTICAKKMKKKMKKNIATSIFGQYGQNLYAQRLQVCAKTSSGLWPPKRSCGSLWPPKKLYDYISNNSKILLDTIWIMYSICDKQRILEKVFFFLNTHPH